MYHQGLRGFEGRALRAGEAVAGALMEPAEAFGHRPASDTPVREGPRDGTMARVGSARITRCAADRAGIGRFVYLLGHSGRRYVFCGIDGARARLYDSAVFGLRDGDGMVLSARWHALGARPGLLYVHLLEADGPAAADVMADLAG